MKKFFIFVVILIACSGVKKGSVRNPHLFVDVKNFGQIEIELYPREAPRNVNNVIKLSRSGFYNGLTMYRVIKGFLVQFGCPRGDGSGFPGYYIEDEISRNLTIQRGTVAMANKGPNTNGSQIFISLRPCPELDGCYTIIGQLINGWDVIEKICEVKTNINDFPRQKITIEKVWVE